MFERMGKIYKLQIFTGIFICILIISSGIPLFVIGLGKADSNNIYVNISYLYSNGNGSADRPYRSIQKAINAASNGDKIFVFKGTYNETLIIDKQISLIGLDKNKTVIYRGGIAHRNLIEINADYVVLENFTISDVGNLNMVTLVYVTSDYVTIHGNKIISSSTWGLYFDSSNDNTIGNNVINDTKGIRLSYSNNNVFSNNNFNYCKETAIALLSSSNSIVFNNTINHSKLAITTQSGSINNNISKNTINNTDIDGIKITDGDSDIIENNIIDNSGVNGLNIDSSNSIITGNKFYNNQIGISLRGSNCILYDNFVNNSRSFGLYTYSTSTNNIIYLNNFNDNLVNVHEYGDNQWYNEMQGNYWDDYSEVDKDLDKIGDTPYSKGGVLDIYPLGVFLKPPNKPTSPSPSDGAENVGLSITLIVNVSDFDSDLLDVYFYRASDDKLYGIDYDVQNNSNASCSFNLPFETTFPWYAVASDGKLDNRSNISIFTTKQIPPSNQKPIADPGGPYSSIIGEEIIFDGSNSSDPDGKIDFYRWSFGDGSSQILAISPTHIYSNPGTYTVTLTVVDNHGRSSTETSTITVSAFSPPNVSPDASLEVQSSSAIPRQITFDGSGSYDTDGMILNYTWDFGDGNIGYGSSVVHNYSEDGTYTISLTVTDDNGNSNTTSTTIAVGFSSSSDETQDFKMDYIIFILIAIAIIAGISAGIFFWRFRQE